MCKLQISLACSTSRSARLALDLFDDDGDDDDDDDDDDDTLNDGDDDAKENDHKNLDLRAFDDLDKANIVYW